MKLLKDSLRKCLKRLVVPVMPLKCKSLDLCLVRFESPFELNPARVQL